MVGCDRLEVSRWRNRVLLALLLAAFAILAASCGDDGGDTVDDSSDDASDIAQGIEAQTEVTIQAVTIEIANGFGTLGASQQATVQGIADGDAVCDNRAGPRADPSVSQIEVEVVTAVEGCLQFSYDVANFRSLVDDIDRLRQDRDVVAVSPLLLDYHLSQTTRRQPPEADDAWPLAAIQGDQVLARADTETGRGIVIAVIDSGIDTTRAGLEQVAIERVSDTGEGDYTETGHGTVAATIIAAPIGFADRGIAPQVTLLDVPADLCDRERCGCDPCAEMTPAEAIRWSADNGADIISMSFGYQPTEKPAWWQMLLDADDVSSATETIEVALAYAQAKGILMVAAAGNCSGEASLHCSGEDQFEIPAGHDGVIAVGALDSSDGLVSRAWYSTKQSYVELAAPGSVLTTTSDGESVSKVGTSFATPFVSAALAVLLGDDGPLADQPDAAAVARAILIETAIDLVPTGRDDESGHGQLQLNAAVQAGTTFAAEHPVPVVDAEADAEAESEADQPDS